LIDRLLQFLFPRLQDVDPDLDLRAGNEVASLFPGNQPVEFAFEAILDLSHERTWGDLAGEASRDRPARPPPVLPPVDPVRPDLGGGGADAELLDLRPAGLPAAIQEFPAVLLRHCPLTPLHCRIYPTTPIDLWRYQVLYRSGKMEYLGVLLHIDDEEYLDGCAAIALGAAVVAALALAG
jgi:hypothetical protein